MSFGTRLPKGSPISLAMLMVTIHEGVGCSVSRILGLAGIGEQWDIEA